MSHIVLASASADLSGRVQDAVEGVRLLSLLPGPLPATPARLLEQLGDAGSPDVVVLDTALSGSEEVLSLAARFEQQHPGIAVVLVSDQAAEISLAAMRAGVRDILPVVEDSLEIRRVLSRAYQYAQAYRASQDGADGPAPTGRIISVVSAKGGVGKTTVATNLAVGLARVAPHATVLVDLDLQFGDAASALNLDPEFSLPDAVRGPAVRDTMALKTFLTQHETGLYVLCGPPTPAAADAVTTEDVERLLQMLASEFRYVVVDTAPGLSEHTLTVMDQTSDLVLVTSMDVPGIRGLRKELDTLAALNLSTETRHILVNLADTRAGLSRSDVEATLGTAVDLMLPRSKGAATSVNQGIPLLQSDARDPVTKRLRELVGLFSPAASRTAQPDRRAGRPRGRHRATRKGRR